MLGVFLYMADRIFLMREEQKIMSETVYIKISLSAKVHKTNVTVGDIAKIYCEDKNIKNKIKSLRIYTFHNPKDNRIIFSSIKLIEIICTHCPNVDVTHIGEPDFVIEYSPINKKSFIPPWLVAAVCCVIIFFGSAFTIMTFNTDVSVPKVFTGLYEDFTGLNHDNVTILEVSYSIGIGLGIIIFYNHFGKRKITKDPTPIELEMRKYETEINTALVDGVSKKEDFIDVD